MDAKAHLGVRNSLESRLITAPCQLARGSSRPLPKLRSAHNGPGAWPRKLDAVNREWAQASVTTAVPLVVTISIAPLPVEIVS